MTDEPRWFTCSDWTTAHLLRPGITCVHRDDKQARVTLCGRRIAHPYPAAAHIGEKCGRCARRDNDSRRNT